MEKNTGKLRVEGRICVRNPIPAEGCHISSSEYYGLLRGKASHPTNASLVGEGIQIGDEGNCTSKLVVRFEHGGDLQHIKLRITRPTLVYDVLRFAETPPVEFNNFTSDSGSVTLGADDELPTSSPRLNF